MKCPDCYKVLIDVATSCRCGWKAEQQKPAMHIQCDDGLICTDGALYRVDADGWKNYCLAHYIAHFTRLARRNTSEEPESFRDKWAAW